MARRGLVPIEEVQVGDLVLTHRGRWQPVRKTMQNLVHDQVRRIQAQGFDPLEVTGNHPVWAARYGFAPPNRVRYAETGWVAARDVRPKVVNRRVPFDALTLPLPVMGTADAHLDLTRLVHGNGRFRARVRDGMIVHSHPLVKPLPVQVPMNAAFGRLLGFYVAEGSTTNNEVQWAFHEDEVAYQQQVLDDLRSVFGLTGKLEPKPENRCIAVTCQNVLLAQLFSCGKARTKRLPEWAWGGSPEFYSSLLWAWVAGDGYLTAKGWRGYTTSRDLAWQMRLVALACGLEPSLRLQKQSSRSVIRGRKINGGDSIYAVEVFLGKGTGEGIYGKRRGIYRIDGPHLTSPVRSNEPSAYDGIMVYNLEVAEDESYVTTGGTVHNCMQLDVMPTSWAFSRTSAAPARAVPRTPRRSGSPPVSPATRRAASPPSRC